MKKGLLIVAAVLMLANIALAGDYKTDNWPCTFVPQKLFTIPVYMNIGYYVKIVDQNKEIKLTQSADAKTTYEGCVKFKVQSNFNAILKGSVAKFPADPSPWIDGFGGTSGSVKLDGADTATVDALTEKEIEACVKITKLNMAKVPGGTTKFHVADVTITVVPSVAIPCAGQV